MIGALYAYLSALLVFGLTGEAHSPFLVWTGTIYAIWLTIAGSIMGWRFARNYQN